VTHISEVVWRCLLDVSETSIVSTMRTIDSCGRLRRVMSQVPRRMLITSKKR